MREDSLAEILRPCSIVVQLAKEATKGTELSCNLSDLCLNVSPHSIAIIRNSVEAFIASMAAKETAEAGALAIEEGVNLTDLWTAKETLEEDHWFLKPEESLDALDTIPAMQQQQTHSLGSSHGSTAPVNEHAIIKISNLVVKIESGVGHNTVPLLLLDTLLSLDEDVV